MSWTSPTWEICSTSPWTPFFRNVRDHGKDFRTITDAERRALVKRAVEEVSAKYRNTIMKSSARNATWKKGGADHGPDGAGADLPDPEGRFERRRSEVDVSTRIPLEGWGSVEPSRADRPHGRV